MDDGAMCLPSARDGEVLLWKRVPRGMSSDERKEADEWLDARGIGDLEVRDALMSRILRHPELVNRAAEPHGFANCYVHHPGDLVIEWCCGDSAEVVCANLLAQGFAEGLPPEKAIELFSQNSIGFGDGTVILRRHSSCLYGSNAAKVTEAIQKRYES
ncbi:hypothetical protein [Streptomyces sp. LaPpAH-108]|uniref:hypothetical protein n=1 Tax=Streptomyces sp. LaPpAH-108 TaxID=1155714 RepID=UPI001F36FBE2|nr:hypothetical protein [Streptomyces sp. LaPpAH-108]